MTNRIQVDEFSCAWYVLYNHIHCGCTNLLVSLHVFLL